MTSAGQRLMPRHLEYRLTNSDASRAYFETGCRSQYLMMFGPEALLVLDLHGVEGAAVGIDADEEGLLRLQVGQGLAAAG